MTTVSSTNQQEVVMQ